MICKKCGYELPDNAKFCGKCGASTSDSDKTVLLAPANGQSNDETVLLTGEQESVPDSDKTVMLASANGQSNDETVLLTGERESVPDSDKTVLLAPANGQSKDETVLLTGERESVPDSGKTDSVRDGVKQLNPGDVLEGIYRVTNIIGKGGFGYIYKAYHTRLEQDVVIKQIHRPNTGLSNRTEADVLKKIKHTYLPQVHDFFEQDGTAFTVMDLISGADIDKLVKGGRKFRQKEIVKAAVQLCEAVRYLHGLKPPIIHSDIKPENIMLTDSGDICLIDMNVSLVFDKNASLIGGTPDYAPPEQMGIPLSEIKSGVSKLTLVRKGTPNVNERSDIYSIGASIYFMAVRKKPALDYSTKPIADLVAAGLSEPLGSIVAKAMSLDPAKRYRSVNEMLTALNNLGKLDRRYKALQAQRAVVTACAAVMIFGSVTLNRMGADKLKEEHEEKYAGYVLQMETGVESGEYEKAEEAIRLAKEFEPSRVEPFLNEAKILSQTGQYEKSMEYADKTLTPEIMTNEKNSREIFGEIYGLSANSAFELEMYDRAVNNFEKALLYAPNVVEFYRDLTISQARLGNIGAAEASLEKAVLNGISDDRLDLMQGEISLAKGEYEKAFESFSAALKKTDDDYLRFRTLLAYDKAAAADNSEDSAQSAVKLLETELGRVSLEYSNTVREMLANEYARCGEFSGNVEYYDKAAGIYGELMSGGNLNYSLKKNYYNILFSQLRDYESCLKILDEMEKENSGDYWIPMNRAYVQISVQNAVEDQSKRDYKASYESYLKAEELYKQFAENGRSDPNMDTLRASVKELIKYGWIKEN